MNAHTSFTASPAKKPAEARVFLPTLPIPQTNPPTKEEKDLEGAALCSPGTRQMPKMDPTKLRTGNLAIALLVCLPSRLCGS